MSILSGSPLLSWAATPSRVLGNAVVYEVEADLEASGKLPKGPVSVDVMDFVEFIQSRLGSGTSESKESTLDTEIVKKDLLSDLEARLHFVYSDKKKAFEAFRALDRIYGNVGIEREYVLVTLIFAKAQSEINRICRKPPIIGDRVMFLALQYFSAVTRVSKEKFIEIGEDVCKIIEEKSTISEKKKEKVFERLLWKLAKSHRELTYGPSFSGPAVPGSRRGMGSATYHIA